MSGSRGQRIAVRVAVGAGLVGVLAYAAQAAFAVCGSGADRFFELYVYNGLIVLAAGVCLSRAAFLKSERGPWVALGAGLLLWAGGEAYYSLALEGLDAPPVPSGADALWLAFYPACYVALVLVVRARVKEFHTSLWLDGAIGGLAVAALGSALLVGVLTAGGADTRTVALDLSYLLGDLLLLAFVIGTFAVTGWRPGRALVILGAGLALGAVVDGYFLHEAATGGTTETTVIASLWPASALLTALAAWQKPARRESVKVEGLRLLVMPAAFGALALGLLGYHAFETLNPAAVTMALATLAAVIVRMAATFRENLRLLERSRQEALSDPLTGLANRRRLMFDLEQAVGRASMSEPAALMLFDLDGFKLYNDRYGHPLGDALLSRLGRRLRAAVTEAGRAYRLGGDEFCVVAWGDQDRLHELAEEAREALSERGEGFAVTSSCGVVVIPHEADGVTYALHLADQRLYSEKGGTRRAAAGRQASDALLEVLKEREPEMPDHVEEVARLARNLGNRLQLPSEDLEDLSCAAELHDVGKVALPEEILRKPGPLDANEWAFVRQHTVVGDRILSAAPALSSAAKLVRASHERYDGTGYPDGLAGEEIPLGARIVAVCDAYHAMVAGRPYRTAIEPAEALDELRKCAGTQFDPLVVDAFCGLIHARSDGAAGRRAAPFEMQHARAQTTQG